VLRCCGAAVLQERRVDSIVERIVDSIVERIVDSIVERIVDSIVDSRVGMGIAPLPHHPVPLLAVLISALILRYPCRIPF